MRLQKHTVDCGGAAETPKTLTLTLALRAPLAHVSLVLEYLLLSYFSR